MLSVCFYLALRFLWFLSKTIFCQVRVRSKINLHFQVLRRTHGKARGGRIAGYLTNEQRSHAGWIGASKCEVIFERALSESGVSHACKRAKAKMKKDKKLKKS